MADMLSRLRTDSPLHLIDRALEARLKGAFPEAKQFRHGVVPAKPSVTAWAQLTTALPFIGRGWVGVKPGAMSGSFAGRAQFVVFLLDRTDQAARLLHGEPTKPGLFALAMVASAVLHGLRIPDAGTVEVTGLDQAYADQLGDEKIGMVGLALQVPFGLADCLDPAGIEDFLLAGVTWPDIPTTDVINLRG